jgi:CheY-like chemotaxis protein
VTEEKDLRKKVLIAEDDPVSRRILKVFLSRWGYRVVVAASGTEAQESAAAMGEIASVKARKP